MTHLELARVYTATAEWWLRVDSPFCAGYAMHALNCAVRELGQHIEASEPRGPFVPESALSEVGTQLQADLVKIDAEAA